MLISSPPIAARSALKALGFAVLWSFVPMLPALVAQDFDGSPLFVESEMNVARSAHRSVILKDGRLMVIGGLNSGDVQLRSCEIYDPVTKVWTRTGNLRINRWSIPAPFGYSNGPAFTATLLMDGRVLVTGGIVPPPSFNLSDRAEIYDPETRIWRVLENRMNAVRANHSAVLMGNGQVYISGGQDTAAVLLQNESFDPATNTFIQEGSPAALQLNRRNHQSFFLPTQGDPTKGRVIIVGGLDSVAFEAVDTVDAFDPDAPRDLAYTELPPMARKRFNFSITYLGNTDDIALIVGGRAGLSFLLDGCEILKRDGNGQLSFSEVDSLPIPLAFPRLASAVSGYSPHVLAIGGRNIGMGVKSIFRFDLGTERWSNTGLELQQRLLFHSVAHDPFANKVYVTGGISTRSGNPTTFNTSLFPSGRLALRMESNSKDPIARRGEPFSIAIYLENLTDQAVGFQFAELTIDRPVQFGVPDELLGARRGFVLPDHRERRKHFEIDVPAAASPGEYVLLITARQNNGHVLSEAFGFQVESGE